jgi:hypothetical protein
MVLASLVALHLAVWSSLALEEKPEARRAEPLSEFQKAKKKQGWEPVATDPDTRKPQKAIVRTKGNLKGLREKQQVTLRYTWVVVSESLVGSSTDKFVQVEFHAGDTAGSVFEVELGGQRMPLELDLAEKPSHGPGGAIVKVRVETGKRVMRLVLSAQQVLEVYSDEKTPRLLARGYLGSYTVVELKKAIKE